MEEQYELFENDVLAHDADDPPPKVGYADAHWWLNRIAEECARFLRLCGFF